MRLLGQIKDHRQSMQFQAFLQKEGIEAIIEPVSNETGVFAIWIEQEDQLEKARKFLLEYLKDPESEKFQTSPSLFSEEEPSQKKSPPFSSKTAPLKSKPSLLQKSACPLTIFIILLCALLYLWNGRQLEKLEQEKSGAFFYGLTPLFMTLSYDLPPVFPLYVKFFKKHSVQSEEELKKLIDQDPTFREIGREAPYWKGVYGLIDKSNYQKGLTTASLFIKLREKQIWRLFTPALMHGNFFHIFFNMLWLWLLGKQVEERVKKWQYVVLTLMLASFTNTLQYLMSGPLFLGYSGVITGLAGFIWMRQKRAPWEGYSINRKTLLFLMIYITVLFAIGVITFFVEQATNQKGDGGFNIANTAHISGAMFGAILGRISSLSRAKF